MIEELNAAGQHLISAFDEYINVCSSFQNCYFGTLLPITAPPELSSHIAAQGQLIAALELKLRKAENTVNRIHNRSASLVPIHALPLELIERIFQYASVFAQPMEPQPDLSGHPAVVAYVCSRWRRIALGLPWLWRYINMPLIDGNTDVAPVNRGLVFANRTHPLPLDILFYAGSGSGEASILDKSKHRKAIVDTVAPCTRSLEFVFNFESDFAHHRFFLSEYIINCTPGALKVLITSCRDIRGSPPVFVDAPVVMPEYLGGCQAFQYASFGPVLESLTLLRLHGVYPFWTSKAYHGLVELRLASRAYTSPWRPLISEEHLLGILKASPALRIFHFSIGIPNPLPRDAEVVPIPLDHLEVLNVAGIELRMLGYFLRWLSPGPKPLQFAISGEPANQYSFHSGVESFFSRSNVTRIYAERDSYANVFNLLRFCPHLNTLAWHPISPYEVYESTQYPFPISHPCLESLFIGRSTSVVKTQRFFKAIGESSTLKRVWFSDTNFEPGFIDKLKSRSGVPDVRQVDYDPARDCWEGLDSWLRN